MGMIADHHSIACLKDREEQKSSSLCVTHGEGRGGRGEGGIGMISDHHSIAHLKDRGEQKSNSLCVTVGGWELCVFSLVMINFVSRQALGETPEKLDCWGRLLRNWTVGGDS